MTHTSTDAQEVDAFTPAATLLHALHERRISAVELLDLHLDRIARYNPALNAIVTPAYDQARQDAARADAARARGEDGPLLGLPLTVKETIDIKGLPTTGGVPEHAHDIAEDDAPIVARARAAGAVIMGKTNVSTRAADWQSANPLFGRTNNPWDLTRTPGGSTGGGAAALAAGLTPLEFGSDFAGSIRIPAAFCGVYGHKSSETAVPRSGSFPRGQLPNPATSLGVQGPLARSAEDLMLALDVIAGPDTGEDVAWRIAFPPARHDQLVDYRVAVLPLEALQPVDAEIAMALGDLAAGLRRLGARVKQAQPDAYGDPHDYYRLYLAMKTALLNRGRPRAERQQQADRIRATVGANPVVGAIADGLVASADDYIDWFDRRERYRASYRAFFQQWDILLAPANIVNAFPHMERPVTLNLNGQEVPYAMQDIYPGLCNLSGHPGTAFPAARTRAGLPIGLQAIGPYLEDRTSIRFAALVAQEFGGFQAAPGYGVGRVLIDAQDV